jgi:hypothetical protein
MSVLIYNPRMSWEQTRVSSNVVVHYLMNGWAIVHNSAMKQ